MPFFAQDGGNYGVADRSWAAPRTGVARGQRQPAAPELDRSLHGQDPRARQILSLMLSQAFSASFFGMPLRRLFVRLAEQTSVLPPYFWT